MVAVAQWSGRASAEAEIERCRKGFSNWRKTAAALTRLAVTSERSADATAC